MRKGEKVSFRRAYVGDGRNWRACEGGGFEVRTTLIYQEKGQVFS